jgi:myo-inositol-1(or 4)-monophosphatase
MRVVRPLASLEWCWSTDHMRLQSGLLGYDRCMPQPDLDAQLDIAVDAARRAGRIQMERYERLERIVHKSEHDVVTEVDHLSEALIIEAIRRVFPDDAFLAEESGHSPGRPTGVSRGAAPKAAAGHDSAARHDSAAGHRIWIIDPLDGTVNYANGIPVFCVSIALVIGGKPTLGAVYDPTRDEMFTAIAGRGAQLDGAPISHPTKAKLSDAVVSLALPHYRFARREGRIRKAIRVARNMGSASLALTYVANGRFDAFVQQGGLSLWDIAAAGLIAEEGGATVTDVGGGPWFDPSSASRSIGLIAAAAPHHGTLRQMLG